MTIEKIVPPVCGWIVMTVNAPGKPATIFDIHALPATWRTSHGLFLCDLHKNLLESVLQNRDNLISEVPEIFNASPNPVP